MPTMATMRVLRQPMNTSGELPSLPKLRPIAAFTLAALAQLAVSGMAYAAGEETLPAITVHAQGERADGPVTGYRAERSATFTKTDTSLKDVPASVQVVPAQLMEDQGMTSMADVLRYVPGATMGQGEGNRDQPVLRGINTTSDFFVDGVRDDAQYFRDLYNLERVEVLRGPGGMAFGRGGAGGVINRVTKRADFKPHSEVSLSAGTEGLRRGTVDIGNKINDVASWRLNAMVEDSDSFRDVFYLKRHAVNPTLTLAPGANTAITLGYEYLDDERLADRGIPSQNGRPYETSRSQFFGSPDQNEAKSTLNGFYAVLDHDFGNGLQLKNTFRATKYDKFYQNVYPGSPVSTGGTLTLSAYNHDVERTNYFNQTDLISKFNALGFEHTLLTGVEIGHQKNRGFGFAAANMTNVPATNARRDAGAFTTVNSNNRSTGDLVAAYVQDQVTLNKEWKITAGLRYDQFKVELDDLRPANQDLERTDKEVSPRLGVVWQPSTAQTYYASYSYSFLPSGENLSLATNNAELEPEEALNYEIGARWDLGPALTLSAAIFRTDRDKVKTRDPLDATRLQLSGLQRTEGVELSLQGDVMKNWQVYAGAAYLDARTEKPVGGSSTAAATPAGRRVGLVPKRSFSLWNKFDLAGGWGLGLGVVYQSEMYTSLTNTVKLPSFVRTDGAVYYTFNDKKTRVALNIENLFDKKYYPTAHSDNNISPGAPRTAMLTVATSF
ncbi:MAG TPA: TonB-dependent siderophore receptor [Noviherbaspirillum sp.]|nr:TonB-dependent siderophore receptor [Noviherbaspirillum sp.]